MAMELKEVNGEKRVALAIVTSSSGLDRVCCALRVSLENGPPHYPDNTLLDGNATFVGQYESAVLQHTMKLSEIGNV